jgi:hypothetical protein
MLDVHLPIGVEQLESLEGERSVAGARVGTHRVDLSEDSCGEVTFGVNGAVTAGGAAAHSSTPS